MLAIVLEVIPSLPTSIASAVAYVLEISAKALEYANQHCGYQGANVVGAIFIVTSPWPVCLTPLGWKPDNWEELNN
jgi:hypothetical protein